MGEVRAPSRPYDDELERQLAVLDALEQRQARRRAEAGGEPDTPETLHIEVLRQKVWPDEIPQPPALDDTRALASYLAWIDVAGGILARRIESNRTEHLTLASHWAHVLRNLDRLKPAEVAAVVEGQARARERIAADQAMQLLLAAERERVSELAGQHGGSELRGILDGLHPRFEDRPARPLAALLTERLGEIPGESGLDLAWDGPDVADPGVRSALVWLVEEVTAMAVGRCEARVRVADGELVVRAAAAILGAGPAGTAPWVGRCRARAGLASGSVSVTSRAGRSVLEARFGVS